MVTVTYPGVYVEEVPSGVRTISGVSTSITLFIGFTRSGPVNKPVDCTSFSDYVAVYGNDVTAGDMTRQVKLFFANQGARCYVLRVASGADVSSVSLMRVGTPDQPRLRLDARNPGVAGDLIRAAIRFDGSQPEDTFTLDVFRWEVQSDGTFMAKDPETHLGLSMDEKAGSYAPAVLEANSKLVLGTVIGAPLAAATAASYAMRRFPLGGPFDAEWGVVVTPAANLIEVSIDGSPFIKVALPVGVISTVAVANGLKLNIDNEFMAKGLPAPPTLGVAWSSTATFQRLRISSDTGSVFVRPHSPNDAAAGLLWSTEQGGIESTPFQRQRPAPTGVVLPRDSTNFDFFDALLAETSISIQLNKYASDGIAIPVVLTTSWTAALAASVDGLREVLQRIRETLDSGPVLGAGEYWPWSAELWSNRLAILPTNGPILNGQDDNRASGFSVTAPAALTGVVVVDNIRFYQLNTTGLGAFQVLGKGGKDGTAPTSMVEYETAYEVVQREVDLFNLMVLPRSAEEVALTLEMLWPNASAFCEKRRALLLMEAPLSWTGHQVPANAITILRNGISKQYAALYYPRLTVQEDRKRIQVGATGAMAGLMARIDSSRGVWKAPAGTEADLRSVVGVSERLSNAQNGVLNPRGINVIRALDSGIVAWGARTLDGDDNFGSEYKYVPIRRLALFLEESLYRGLQWVVFEPNDEPLWAQIRLNVGVFMHGLFRRGAFQGRTPQEAYFVKCDAETTPQADRNLGIVNVWVGFAPLKPAEFVVLKLQQMAGQLQV